MTLLSDTFPAAGLVGVTFHRLNPPRHGWLRRFGHVPREVAFALSAKSAIRQLRTRGGVDVVLCHGHPVAALAARPLKRRYGIPYAMVTHGDIFDRPKGTYDPRLTWFYQRVTGPAYRGADQVIALSPHMASLAIRGGATTERVSVIPNGIEPAEIGLDETTRQRPREPTGRLELLYVGRLSIEKGVDVLIAAAGLLKASGVAFRLRIIGSGPEEQRLRSRVDEAELDGYVVFLGPVPRLELGALYCSADVVCVPSRSDPLPTVVLEAMASGRLVLGSKVGGIPFMVQDGQTGWLVPPGDPSALAQLILDISSAPLALTGMSLVARQMVTERFNWDGIGIRLSEVISRVIESNEEYGYLRRA